MRVPASPNEQRGRGSPPRLVGAERNRARAAAPNNSDRTGHRDHRDRSRQYLTDFKLEFLGKLRWPRHRGMHGRNSKVAAWNSAVPCQRNQLSFQPVPCAVGRRLCKHGRRRKARRAQRGRRRWWPRSPGSPPKAGSRGTSLVVPIPWRAVTLLAHPRCGNATDRTRTDVMWSKIRARCCAVRALRPNST